MSSALAIYPRTKEIIRVDLAPPTQIGNSLMHPTLNKGTFIPPFNKNLKTIAHVNFKPHVAPLRTDFVRHSMQNPLVLPKLTTPGGRNRSMVNKT